MIFIIICLTVIGLFTGALQRFNQFIASPIITWEAHFFQAVRPALDYKSTWRAVGVFIIDWVIQMFVVWRVLAMIR